MSEVVRGMEEKEREKVLKFASSIMGAAREYFEAMWRLAPAALPEHSRILLSEGRIASHMHLYFRRMYLGAARVLVGHIGDVCTDPTFRHRGYGTRLLEDSAEYFRRHDAPLSMIISGVFGFYYHGGYQSFPLKRCVVDLSKAPERSEGTAGYFIRRAMREIDLPACAVCYHEYNRRRPLTVVREMDYWRRQFWGSRRETEDGFLVAEADGEIAAYVRTGRDSILEAAYVPEHAGALAPLFEAAVNLARKRRLERLTVQLPQDEPFLSAIQAFSEPEEYLTTLVKVVDLLRLLEDVASGLNHVHQRPLFDELDGWSLGVRVDGKAACLVFRSKGVTAREGIPKGLKDVFDLDGLGLVEMLSGRSLPGGGKVRKRLERVFAAPAPYFWPMDTV